MPGARGDGNRHRGGRSLRRPVRPTARRLPEPERAVPRGSLPLQQGGRRPRSPRLPDGGKTQRLGYFGRSCCRREERGRSRSHSTPKQKEDKERNFAHTTTTKQNKTKQKKERKERGCERARGEERPVPDVAGKRRRCRQPRPGIAPARNDSPTRDRRSGGKTDGPSGVRSLRVSPRAGAQGGPGPGVRPAGARGCPPELAALLPARRPGCPGARVTPPSATRGI
ncbi:translation initiation factor IF-2-like isoform X3 [Falco cherrug]|uniref:translation initiation factor IF-2-like isoform X3 n=1 Tax=Falco cherrug TaxID=345164 RepID=UPI00247AF5DC|nr:translation initiation factor IF-2-like isoform X3 [Falco cherrug]XP_055661735.1 translation initiation factor IF-2-like isoform X4 [Falco peregrinus]